MKKLFRTFCSILSLASIFSATTFAQYPEDALRLSYSNLSVGARSLGIGSAFTAVADDYSATFVNPAGLGQLRMNELSLGMSHNGFGNTSSFYGSSQSLNNSSTNINSFGLVYAVPTTRGSFVIALGYGKQSDFTSALSFSGFNPVSSLIQSWAPDSGRTDDPGGNLAYELYLANADSVGPSNYRWDSKILNNVTQSGKVLEGGGINHWSASAGVEAARNLYLGATVSFISGSYSYTRTYREADTRNIYETQPFDLASFEYINTITDDISGFNARLGLLYKINDRARFGMAIKTPSFITVRETFSDEATSLFDNRDTYSYRLPDGRIEYDVRTPFQFSGGVAYDFSGLMLSGDLEYVDWSQMEFANTDATLLALNPDIKQIFRPAANIRVGAEYTFSEADFHLRGGFAYLPSPYTDDPASFAQKFVTAGFGFSIENAIGIDVGYSHGFWDTKHINYADYLNGNPTSETQEQVSTNNVITSVSYRF
ncbi:MAG TPA: outer membrane protein transport protein [Bacteroidota bacterium]|nr:outer membrane protein transport protein [Bacteroidota bacterium]